MGNQFLHALGIFITNFGHLSLLCPVRIAVITYFIFITYSFLIFATHSVYTLLHAKIAIENCNCKPHFPICRLTISRIKIVAEAMNCRTPTQK